MMVCRSACCARAKIVGNEWAHQERERMRERCQCGGFEVPGPRAKMYNLHLSAEQLEIRDTVRDFVARKVEPVALNADRLQAPEQPLLVDVLDQASQMGLRTLALSEELGGAGGDALTCCIVSEELAAGDVDVAAVLAETSSLGRILFGELMTAAQRERFLPQFVADDRYHLALAEREPDQNDRGPRRQWRMGCDRHQGLRRQRSGRQAVGGPRQHQTGSKRRHE